MENNFRSGQDISLSGQADAVWRTIIVIIKHTMKQNKIIEDVQSKMIITKIRIN